jgi:ferrochelatase
MIEATPSVTQHTNRPGATAKAQPRVGVLLVQLGTPDSPSVPDVRKYLRQFLMDGRVIDIPRPSVRCSSTASLRRSAPPSPAKCIRSVDGTGFAPAVLQRRRDECCKSGSATSTSCCWACVTRTRAWKAPSNSSGPGARKHRGHPLFPQYASATTGSVYEKVMRIVKDWQIIPEMRFVNRFLEHPKFLEAFTLLGRKYMAEHPYDHFLFSYHGLPERQIHKGDYTGNTCKLTTNAAPRCTPTTSTVTGRSASKPPGC